MPSEIGLSFFRNADAQSILQHTLDFSSAIKVSISPDFIPQQYRVLAPDRRSSAGGSNSPNSFVIDRGISRERSYDDSSTTSSSPLSYTKELTNVSSPLTPLSDARRSKSKSPSQLAVTNGCRFLVDDNSPSLATPADADDGPESAKIEGRCERGSLEETQPSTSKQTLSPLKIAYSPVISPTKSVEKKPAVFQSTPLKQRTMTIKIGPDIMTRKPLVDYGSEDGSSDEDEEEEETAPKKESKAEVPLSPQTIIGPLKPSKLPPVKLQPISTLKRNGEALSTPPATKRKRLLSERGEKESAYPVMDKSTVSSWNWSGCSAVIGKSRGAGLYNSSNDCFLNAILQIITHTAPLCRYIMERHNNCMRPQGQCVCCALRSTHLKKCLQSNATSSAGWIKSHLRRIFPSHIPGMQEDAHELLALLLDAIDPPITKGGSSGILKEPSTPVEQIFGGTLRNQVACDVCKTVYNNYERIRELNLAIKKRQDEGSTRISYLIEHYFRDENLSSFDCKKCGRKTTATRKTRVLRPPAVLLVQLKRFNAYGGKIRLPVTADMDVDITRFIQEDGPAAGTNAQYVLTSVVEHLGAGVDHGHYVAYCRGFDHKQWFLFDDEAVQGISGQKVLTSSQPYLLVYSRREDLNLAPMKAVDGSAFQKALNGGSSQHKSNGFGPRNQFNGNGNSGNRNYNGYSTGINNKKFNSSFGYKLI